MTVTIDGQEWELAAYAANADMPVSVLKLRLQRRSPPYTSAELLTDGRALNAAARGQQTRDAALRAAVMALRETGASIRAIAKVVNRSPACVQQIIASEQPGAVRNPRRRHGSGTPSSSSGGNGSAS